MQGYQKRLIFVALFITVTYANPTINSFGPHNGTPGTEIVQSSIYSTHVELVSLYLLVYLIILRVYYFRLWANVTNCPTTNCACSVRTEETEDDPLPLPLLGEKADKGSIQISNLQPNTTYTFTLSCKTDATPAATVNVAAKVTTDYARPSAPQNITASLDAKKLKVTWSPPSIVTAPVTHYRVTIDTVTKDVLNETSYQVSEDYKYDIKHTIIVTACYVNKQKQAICSPRAESQTSFVELAPTTTITETTTTTTTTTPVTPKSTGVHSYSISVSMIIFSLVLFIKMK